MYLMFTVNTGALNSLIFLSLFANAKKHKSNEKTVIFYLKKVFTENYKIYLTKNYSTEWKCDKKERKKKCVDKWVVKNGKLTYE